MNKSDQNTLIKLRECIELLIQGERAPVVELPGECDAVVSQLVTAVNHYFELFEASRTFVNALAAGNLEVAPPPHNQIVSPYKQLHASLQHLTWQTQQIAGGDYRQRVHFMGEFSESFNSMVEALAEKERIEVALRETRSQVQHLEGIIPICMYCKQIRDDKEAWHRVEDYISTHSEAKFSHGICPTCFEKTMAKYGMKNVDENS
jgi:hypothetical protein